MFSEGKETNESGNYRLYTGLHNFKVTAINPNKAELAELGITVEEEPIYLSTAKEDDTEFQRLQVKVYIDNDDEKNPIKNSLSFFLENRPSQSGTGKIEYINKYGQTAYLPSLQEIPENMSWYSTEKARPAFKNEGYLIDFFRNILNLSAKNGDEAFLENISQMFDTGDVSVLKRTIGKRPNNKIKILCGVKTLEQTQEDGSVQVRNYQNFYPRKFLRSYTQPNTDPFNKFREDVLNYKESGGAPTTDYGDLDTMAFKLWEGDSPSESTESEGNAAFAEEKWN